jgi:hypothetical protein
MTKLFLNNSRLVLAAMLLVLTVSTPIPAQDLDAAQVRAELELVLLYKSPREAKLNPLGADNIDDPTRIMN